MKPANLFACQAALLQLEWRKFAEGSRIAMEVNAYVNQ
jgi:hypothetical protein